MTGGLASIYLGYRPEPISRRQRAISRTTPTSP